MRLIDADRLKAVLEKNFGHTGGASVLEQMIDEQPTIQPERERGEWSDGYRWQRCSLCKQTGRKSWNYCPNCGADMKGDTT